MKVAVVGTGTMDVLKHLWEKLIKQLTRASPKW